MKKKKGILMLSLAFLIIFGGIVCGVHSEGISWLEAIITVAAIFGVSVVFGMLIVYGLKFLTEE